MDQSFPNKLFILEIDDGYVNLKYICKKWEGASVNMEHIERFIILLYLYLHLRILKSKESVKN